MDRPAVSDDTKRLGRRVGWGFSIGINIVLLWVAHNIVNWGWPPFITEDWTEVRGVVEMSIIVTILVHAAFIGFDRLWFRGLGEAVAALASLIATIRVFSVYPFDFAPYDGPWDVLARAILVFAIVGTVVAVVANIGKMAKNL